MSLRHLLLLALVLWPGHALRSAIIEIPGTCATIAAAESHLLFTAPERARLVKQFDLQNAFAPGDNERHLLKTAILLFKKHAPGLPPRDKAILWEALADLVDARLPGNNYRVSYGFLWKLDDKTTYVFQGPLRFERGWHYTLILDSEGRVLKGPAPLIGDIDRWNPELSALSAL